MITAPVLSMQTTVYQNAAFIQLLIQEFPWNTSKHETYNDKDGTIGGYDQNVHQGE